MTCFAWIVNCPHNLALEEIKPAPTPLRFKLSSPAQFPHANYWQLQIMDCFTSKPIRQRPSLLGCQGDVFTPIFLLQRTLTSRWLPCSVNGLTKSMTWCGKATDVEERVDRNMTWGGDVKTQEFPEIFRSGCISVNFLGNSMVIPKVWRNRILLHVKFLNR